jgi:hypothetical protein
MHQGKASALTRRPDQKAGPSLQPPVGDIGGAPLRRGSAQAGLVIEEGRIGEDSVKPRGPGGEG